MKCAKCGTEIPEASRFCLSCGEAMSEDAKRDSSDDSEFNPSSILLIALAFMMFFFSLVPMFLGYLDGMIIMDVVGVAILVFAVINLWMSRRHEEREAELRDKAAERILKAKIEAEARVKCRYCGAPNDRTSVRCEACGATL